MTVDGTQCKRPQQAGITLIDDGRPFPFGLCPPPRFPLFGGMLNRGNTGKERKHDALIRFPTWGKVSQITRWDVGLTMRHSAFVVVFCIPYL